MNNSHEKWALKIKYWGQYESIRCAGRITIMDID
jgi:hypothetical protein